MGDYVQSELTKLRRRRTFLQARIERQEKALEAERKLMRHMKSEIEHLSRRKR